MPDFRLVTLLEWLVYKLLILLPHGEQGSPVFPRLHSFVKIRLDNALLLSRVLRTLLVARQLQMLVDRICIVLLLVIVLVDNLLGGFNRDKGVFMYGVCFLERASDFHVDLVVVCK